jgi:peptidoglycan/LPS O-acetylase OafA/YrhL
MTHAHSPSASRRQLFLEAAITLAAVVLAFAAFDDITTDRATAFTFEWIGLAACGVWLMILAVRLLRREHRWLGAVSAAAVIAGIGAGSLIRSGTGPVQIESVSTLLALGWFLALAVILAAQGLDRAEPDRGRLGSGN